MEKPFPVIAEEAALPEITGFLDPQTPAILIRQSAGFDIITKSDLIYFLTKQTTDKGSRGT
jgi:predicted transcriptional regulator